MVALFEDEPAGVESTAGNGQEIEHRPKPILHNLGTCSVTELHCADQGKQSDVWMGSFTTQGWQLNVLSLGSFTTTVFAPR